MPSPLNMKPAYGYYGDTEPAYRGQKNQAQHQPKPRKEDAASPTGECEHKWTDYGTLTSGDNPKLEIEACVHCGVQRKKTQPKPRKQDEWTVDGDFVVIGEGDSCLCANTHQAKAIADTHNAELTAERQQLSTEREKVQTLVDALKDTNCLLMSVKGEMYEQAMAQVMENNAALAKVDS